MIAQGSIIANVGDSVDDIHPFIVQGEGHTAISNVEAFSGPNSAVTALGKSADFLLVRGQGSPTITMSGCRMRNYERSSPLTIENTNAKVIARMCIDKDEQLFEH
jgi:predicted methyltransferase